MERHVLVASADPAEQARMAEIVRRGGMLPLPLDTAAQVASALASAEARLLLLDLRLPRIDLETLRRSMSPESGPEPLPLSEIERLHIERVLEFTGGNRSRASRILGISRSTLIEKIRRYQTR